MSRLAGGNLPAALLEYPGSGQPSTGSQTPRLPNAPGGVTQAGYSPPPPSMDIMSFQPTAGIAPQATAPVAPPAVLPAPGGLSSPPRVSIDPSWPTELLPVVPSNPVSSRPFPDFRVVLCYSRCPSASRSGTLLRTGTRLPAGSGLHLPCAGRFRLGLGFHQLSLSRQVPAYQRAIPLHWRGTPFGQRRESCRLDQQCSLPLRPNAVAGTGGSVKRGA